MEVGRLLLARARMVDVGDVRLFPTQSDLSFQSITATVADLIGRGLRLSIVGHLTGMHKPEIGPVGVLAAHKGFIPDHGKDLEQDPQQDHPQCECGNKSDNSFDEIALALFVQ